MATATAQARFTVRHEILDGDDSEPWQVYTPDGHEASFEVESEAVAFASDCNLEEAKENAAAEKVERKELVSSLREQIKGLSLERLRELEEWLGE